MTTKISIKLLVDTRGQRVLFAEAGKDFVDFIFSLLAFPMGSIMKLLSSASMPGSIGNLYQSVKNLDSSYLLPNKDKLSLLEPKISLSGNSSTGLLFASGGCSYSSLQPKIYLCYYNGKCPTASFEKDAICTSCGEKMDRERTLICPSFLKVKSADGKNVDDEGGFVRSVITYTVTDNLEVAPLSAISSITLINKYSVINGGLDMTEKVVHIQMSEGLALLMASLQSKTVLTDVFLKKKCF